MDEQARRTRIEHGGFLIFLAAITGLLVFIGWPFLTPLFWAMLAAIMFQPLYRRVLRNMGGRRNRSAALTLLVITVAVVIPMMIIGGMIVDQATGIYLAIQEEQLAASEYFVWAYDSLPARVQAMVDNSGYGDFDVLQQRALELLQQSVGMIASKALAIGGGVLGFALSFAVGLYAAFFLLRDGEELTEAVQTTLPMKPEIAASLIGSFVAVTRATIKGSIVVGLVQGALGAITFWIVGLPAALLFGLLMAIFSLLPAVGPAIVWVPAAIYLLATGAIWQGLAVIGSGVLVIGLADNALRPILVGRDTGLPDWVILVTTLGGIAALGITGIVVGPVVAGLFITGWTILREQRGVAAP